MNDASVIEVSRCGLACDALLGKRVLALILKMMAGNLLKTVSNWAGLIVWHLHYDNLIRHKIFGGPIRPM